MRKVIAFRATAHQLEVLATAEKIYQKPACQILCEWVETELPFKLRLEISKGAKLRPFSPPPQRLRKRKADACDPC